MFAIKRVKISVPYNGKLVEAVITHCFLKKCDLQSEKYWIILTHGAGGDLKTPQLDAIASHLATQNFAVVCFTCKSLNIKYRIKVFNEVLTYVNKMYEPKGIFIGGRSMGARAALMLQLDPDVLHNPVLARKVIGIICLSYPMHKINNTDDLRIEPLKKSQIPIFFLSGTNDEMCRKDVFENAIKNVKCSYKIHWLDGYNHAAKSVENYQENAYVAAFTDISTWCLCICKPS